MWKRILAIISAILLIGSIFPAYIWFDSTYAKADDVKQNSVSIKINGLKDDIRWYQDQMSYIMSRCGVRDPNKLPDHAHKNYMDYQNRKIELDKELQIEMKKRDKF